jgi:hypothetical protein
MPIVKSGLPQTTARRRIRNGRHANNKYINNNASCSLSLLIVYGMVCMMFLYVTTMVNLVSKSSNLNVDTNLNANVNTNTNTEKYQPPSGSSPQKTKNAEYEPKVYSRDEWGDREAPYKAKREWGHGVQPQLLLQTSGENQPPPRNAKASNAAIHPQRTPEERVLTAYLEPIDPSTWDTKPLPTRTWTSEDLTKVPFSKLNSCAKLPEQWPVDEDSIISQDPFLPWIHDAFPTHDGKFVQFVAQNMRRCQTGTNAAESQIQRDMAPQVSLFQHVAVKRLKNATATTHSSSSSSPRYRLASHDEADQDGMATRFICRFQPSGEETLSVFNFDYEWASFRKKQKRMFHEEGRDNKQIHTSQLTFQCPVPASLVESVRTGASVQDDYATLFIDLIPIRTPPRYGPPNSFLPPHYQEFQLRGDDEAAFDAKVEWGPNHVLPLVENSGRWENIPICQPSLLAYGKQPTEDSSSSNAIMIQPPAASTTETMKPIKQHRLASCLWASSGYATRGNRFAINDGQRRLVEWITYNKLIGIEHFYLYDNSGAFSDDPQNSLQPIADLFPNDITLINWPSKVCNNNPNNVDSVGERSSQYAAEASCRLRFGPHVDWIAQLDIDEYLVPMGNLTTIHTLLDKLDQEGNKIVSFGSWRAWPRKRFIEYVLGCVNSLVRCQ